MRDVDAREPLDISPDSVRSKCCESRIQISNFRSIIKHIKIKGLLIGNPLSSV